MKHFDNHNFAIYHSAYYLGLLIYSKELSTLVINKIQ